MRLPWAAGQSRRSIDGVGLSCVEAGTGEPVLLLHGVPTSSFVWRLVQGLLAPQLRTLALDLLGFGSSDKPDSRDLSLGAQADLVARFILALEVGPVTLVAHDWGGAVAQVVAARYPGVLARLVLVSSHTCATWPSLQYDPFLADGAQCRSTVEDLLRYLRETFPSQVAARSSLSSEALAGYLAPWSTPAAMGAFFQVVRSGGAELLRDLEPALGRLRVPALVVWGEADLLTPPEEGRRLARALPDASFELIARAGHLVPEEAPEMLAQKIVGLVRRTARSL